MWNTPFVRAAAWACILALMPTGAWAQGAGTLINGSVRDASNATAPNALVTLTDVSTGAAHTVKTGADGLYSFQQLGPGAYELRVTLAGFRDRKSVV